MTCHDAREGFAALVCGGIDVTERALLHAHVTQCQRCREERDSPLEPGSAVWLTPLRTLLSIFLTVSGHAAGRTVEVARTGAVRAVGLLTRVRRLPPTLLTPWGRGAANLIGRVRFGLTRCAHRLRGVRAASAVAIQGVARATIEAARAGVRRVAGLLT